ncbi:MAG: hypothetical protein JWP51_5284 [Bradyrhizobium sp.]|jgi:hypothetical protein|nr:hypothetical protein [Bradyrhizobium sp.]
MLEKRRADAEDCLLISRLATDKVKRETFKNLSDHLRQMAVDVEAVIAAKSAAGET